VNEEELKTTFAQARAKNPDLLVLVQADEGVVHGRVVAVMEAARAQGLTRLGIATRAPAEQK
jgi:biopolymer transport protein ExbD